MASLIALLQELHCFIREQRMGQGLGGRGLYEIPLETVKEEKEAREVNYEANTAMYFFICHRHRQ